MVILFIQLIQDKKNSPSRKAKRKTGILVEAYFFCPLFTKTKSFRPAPFWVSQGYSISTFFPSLMRIPFCGASAGRPCRS